MGPSTLAIAALKGSVKMITGRRKEQVFLLPFFWEGISMYYFAAMRAILQLDENVYQSIHAAGRAVTFCMINVSIFGVLHAFSALYFIESLFRDSNAAIPMAGKIQFITIGVGVAFLMHAGAALFLWVFSRGFGGRTAFLPVYFNLGLSFIGLWPLAPVLAALQAGVQGPLLHVLVGLAAIYGLCVIFLGTKIASGLSMLRMSVAMTVTLMVVASLLYLWL
jgi:hypothetical protein